MNSSERSVQWQINCPECGAKIPHYATESEARAAWNRRADKTELLEAAVEVIERQCGTCQYSHKCSPCPWLALKTAVEKEKS